MASATSDLLFAILFISSLVSAAITLVLIAVSQAIKFNLTGLFYGTTIVCLVIVEPIWIFYYQYIYKIGSWIAMSLLGVASIIFGIKLVKDGIRDRRFRLQMQVWMRTEEMRSRGENVALLCRELGNNVNERVPSPPYPPADSTPILFGIKRDHLMHIEFIIALTGFITAMLSGVAKVIGMSSGTHV